MEKVRDILALVVILGLLGASLAGIYFLQKGIEVQIYNPQHRSVVRTIDAVGEIRFVDNKDVFAPFSGRVSEVYVRKGAKVEAGNPLFSYSSTAWEEAIANKQLQVKRYEDQLEVKIAQMERELSQLEENRLDWILREKELEYFIERQKQDLERLIKDLGKNLEREKEELAYLEDLLEGQHISRRDVEQAQDRVDVIKRDLERAKEDLDRFILVEAPLKEENLEREGERIRNNIARVKGEIEKFNDPGALNIVQEEIKILEKDINRLQEQISRRIVEAPKGGYLTSLNIEKGQQINVDSKVMSINDPELLEIVLKVDGRNYHRLEEGLDVEVHLEDVHPPLSGEVNWISPWAESNLVEVGVLLTDRRDLIKPGMQVEATINLQGRRLLVIPPYAVFERKLPDTRMVIREGEEIAHYVFLVDKDTREVYPHRIRIGQVTEDFVEVISGLSASSNLVIGDPGALNQLGAKLSEWERRQIEELKVNFTEGN